MGDTQVESMYLLRLKSLSTGAFELAEISPWLHVLN